MTECHQNVPENDHVILICHSPRYCSIIRSTVSGSAQSGCLTLLCITVKQQIQHTRALPQSPDPSGSPCLCMHPRPVSFHFLCGFAVSFYFLFALSATAGRHLLQSPVFPSSHLRNRNHRYHREQQLVGPQPLDPESSRRRITARYDRIHPSLIRLLQLPESQIQQTSK